MSYCSVEDVRREVGNAFLEGATDDIGHGEIREFIAQVARKINFELTKLGVTTPVTDAGDGLERLEDMNAKGAAIHVLENMRVRNFEPQEMARIERRIERLEVEYEDYLEGVKDSTADFLENVDLSDTDEDGSSAPRALVIERDDLLVRPHIYYDGVLPRTRKNIPPGRTTKY